MLARNAAQWTEADVERWMRRKKFETMVSDSTLGRFGGCALRGARPVCSGVVAKHYKFITESRGWYTRNPVIIHGEPELDCRSEEETTACSGWTQEGRQSVVSERMTQGRHKVIGMFRSVRTYAAPSLVQL